MNKIDVLDAGFVQLMRCADSDLDVVNAARVSFDKESEWMCGCGGVPDRETGPCCHQPGDWKLSDRDTKLIHYLATHNHWSPFSHPQIRFRVKAPIFVRTQLFKHKQGATENEVSRRYVDSEPEMYIPTHWRTRPTDGMKQGSGDDTLDIDGCDIDHADLMLGYYNTLIDDGVAPEQARSFLPQGVYTEWIWTGSLAFFARVYNQRADAHAQWESQQFAHAIGKIMGELFPVSWKALTGKE